MTTGADIVGGGIMRVSLGLHLLEAGANISTSPAIGAVVARLIDGQDPQLDMARVGLARFDGAPFEQLRSEALWRYSAREQWD